MPKFVVGSLMGDDVPGRQVSAGNWVGSAERLSESPA